MYALTARLQPPVPQHASPTPRIPGDWYRRYGAGVDDLGMHRGADGWDREELGRMLFSMWELEEERKRIWYACVIMNKLPAENDPEEMEDWPSACYHVDKL
ncbi:hypothetical protein L208DRAFT_1405924 [Tricholoma matsutake]|nr:hypothetical protein L208DRAFT_1405924 [Tricholoma matsutake 945]